MMFQGGFMASREQILDFDRLCQGEGFLPPFDEPFFPDEGLHMKNVEFWSGKLCTLQFDTYVLHIICKVGINYSVEV